MVTVVFIVALVAYAATMFAIGFTRGRRRVRWVTQELPVLQLPTDPDRYAMPGAPPAGRKVRDQAGQIWKITGQTSQASPFGPWWPTVVLAGRDELGPVAPLSRWWPDLLTLGPVVLVPLTPDEVDDERLYGPIGARWGDPSQPCHFPDCRLGVGHIGAHLDDDDQPLGRFTDPIVLDGVTVWPQPSDQDDGPNLTPCTCDERGTGHAPSCPRWIGSTAVPAPRCGNRPMMGDAAIVGPESTIGELIDAACELSAGHNGSHYSRGWSWS